MEINLGKEVQAHVVEVNKENIQPAIVMNKEKLPKKKEISASSSIVVQTKKNREAINQLLQEVEYIHGHEESLRMQELQKEIKRRMLQTNLSDRRALGGLIGTAVLGIIGLAVGLNVIGIVIGGILGAVVGAYAGKRIKENALRQKKLLNINIHIIRMAALVQHLVDFNIKTVDPQEIRRLMRLLLSDSKMLILLTTKLHKPEHRQVIKIQRRLLKCLRKPKYHMILKEIYWVIKEWCKNSENHVGRWKEQEIEIASLAFSFLRPLSRIMMANRKLLSSQQTVLESKMQALLLSVQIIELRQKYPQFSMQQEDEEEEFLESIYREVELSQLKALMEDQVVQEILKEDQKKEQEMIAQQQGGSGMIEQNGNMHIVDIQQGQNVNEEQIKSPEKQGKDNIKYVVWNSNNGNGVNSPTKQQGFNTAPRQQQQRLIDLIQLASQQKQQELEEIEQIGQKNNNDIGSDHKDKEEGKEDEKKIQTSDGVIGNNNNNNKSSKKQYASRHSLLWFGPEDCTQLGQQGVVSQGNINGLNNHYLQNVKKDLETNAQQEEIKNSVRVNLDGNNNGKLDKKLEGYIEQKQLGNHLDDQELAAQTFSSVEFKTNKFAKSQKEFQIVDENKNNQTPNKVIVQKKLDFEDKENNFTSNIDVYANYQSNIEEGIGQKQMAQALSINNFKFGQCYSPKKGKKQVNDYGNNNSYLDGSELFRGFVKKQDNSESPRKSYVVIDIDEKNAAIQELKEDSECLNIQHQKPLSNSQIKDLNGVNTSTLQASFVRNKNNGGLFLKMNSFDAILTPEIPVSFSLAKYPLVSIDQDDVICPRESYSASKMRRSLRSPEKFSPNKIDNPDNSVNVKNNFNLKSLMVGEVDIKVTSFNNEEQDIANGIDQRIEQTVELEVPNHLGVQEINKTPNKQPKLTSQQSSEKVVKEWNYGLAPSDFYSKDDQAQIDHISINVLGLSGSKKNIQDSNKKENNGINQEDPEIQAKFSRLLELDQENPEKFWEKVIEKDKIKIYKKQIPNNPSVMVRAEAQVEDCTIQEIFDQIYYEQLRTKWDKVTLGFSVIETLGHMQDVIYFYIDPGFGVTKRDFLQKRAVRKDYPSPGDITIIFFSIDHPSFPEKKGWIRAISHIAAYIIRPIEGSKNTHLSIITQSDVKGQIPKYIVNFLAARAPAKWIESMKKGVHNHRKLIKK